MIRSMTAFGSAEQEEAGSRVLVEIRSVNHRFREVVVRIPRGLQGLEEEVRSRVAARVQRGRIEIGIEWEGGRTEGSGLSLNRPLVEGYLALFKELNETCGFEARPSLDTLLQMKDVVLYRPGGPDLTGVTPLLQHALELALDSFERMRRNEGKALLADLEERLSLLEGYATRVGEKAPLVVEAHKGRLEERLRTLMKTLPVDRDRLAQEVAIFADRSDITEELVRIRSHLQQFRDYLRGEEPLGRRLDFLIQELHREANTLGTKAADSEISQVAVEIKAELEKLREQVQNIE